MSASPPQTIYLVTGAGSGLGLGLARIILSRPSVLLLALVRDPSNRPELDELPRGAGTQLLKINYDAADLESAKRAIGELENKHGVTRLDVVIANAGTSTWFGPAIQTPAEYLLKEFQINTLGPIMLFQTCVPLLMKSKEEGKQANPKFIAISSRISSTTEIPNNPQVSCMPYGCSKAALNHAMVKFHTQHPDLIVAVVTPGRTKTGLTRNAIRVGGTAGQNLLSAVSSHTIEESSEGLMKRIDQATREGDSGRFFDWESGEIKW